MANGMLKQKPRQCQALPGLCTFYLLKGNSIADFHDTYHGFTGVQDDFVALVIIVSGGGEIILALFPVDMNALTAGEEPAILTGVGTIDGEISMIIDCILMYELNDHIGEGQLLAVYGIDVGTIGGAGQMLETIVETVVLIVLKITSGQRICTGHINLCCISGTGFILLQGVGLILCSELVVIGIGKTSVLQAHALIDHSLFDSGAVGVCILG